MHFTLCRTTKEALTDQENDDHLLMGDLNDVHLHLSAVYRYFHPNVPLEELDSIENNHMLSYKLNNHSECVSKIYWYQIM